MVGAGPDGFDFPPIRLLRSIFNPAPAHVEPMGVIVESFDAVVALTGMGERKLLAESGNENFIIAESGQISRTAATGALRKSRTCEYEKKQKKKKTSIRTKIYFVPVVNTELVSNADVRLYAFP